MNYAGADIIKFPLRIRIYLTHSFIQKNEEKGNTKMNGLSKNTKPEDSGF
jgi:hypothetical protein